MGDVPVYKSISIHTPTKGVTRRPARIYKVICHFNPHSHEGSDITKQKEKIKYTISIHTPTKGVTKEILKNERKTCISIHTPTKGVTAILSNLGLLFFNFFHQFPN